MLMKKLIVILCLCSTNTFADYNNYMQDQHQQRIMRNQEQFIRQQQMQYQIDQYND